MQDLGNNRHFYELHKVIVNGYFCRSHQKLYSFFHTINKSLHCSQCVSEMRNVTNIFHFQYDQEILSKLLNVFNIKFCRKHNLEITDYCISHMQYYCKRCLEICPNKISLELDKTIITGQAEENYSVKNGKVQVLSKPLEEDHGEDANDHYSDNEDSNDCCSKDDDSNNHCSEGEDSNDHYSEENEEDLSEDQEENPQMFISLWCKNNNSIQNEEINSKPNVSVPIENSNFCYPFFSEGELIIYDSEKNNSKKLTFTNKSLGKNKIDIIKYIAPNCHREFTFFKHGKILFKFDYHKKLFSEVLKLDGRLDLTFMIILGITDNLRLMGFHVDHELAFKDLEKSEDSEDVDDFVGSESSKVDYCDAELVEYIEDYTEYYMTTQKRSIYEFRCKKGGSLLIYFLGFKDNSISFFIVNESNEEFGKKYKADFFKHYKFKDQSKSGINSSFENKIKTLCKNTFIYELDSNLHLCFILNTESYQFSIDLNNQTFKLYKHTCFESKSLGFSVEKKDEDMVNVQSGENVYYLNRDNILIQFDLRNAIFSEKFTFI